MKESIRHVALLAVLLVAACQRDQDGFLFEFNSADWVVGDVATVAGYQIIEWVREGETVDDWNELLTLQKFSRSLFRGSVADMLDGLMAESEAKCPGATEWTVHRREEYDVIYETKTKRCMDFAEHHEIVRIVDGPYSRFRLAYAVKGTSMPETSYTLWMSVLREAEVTINFES